MDGILSWFASPLHQALAGGALVLILLVVLRRLRRRKPGGPAPEIQRLLQAGHFLEAARIEEKQGKLEAALDHYLQAQKPTRAAQLAQRLGRQRQAAELYERARDFPRAIVLYRQAGMGQKADELAKASAAAESPAPGSAPLAAETAFMSPLERAQRAELAFRECHLRSQKGDLHAKAQVEELGREAAEALLAAGDTERAAALCRDAGLTDQAINLYVNLLGNPGAAAALLADRGDHKRAAELYEAAGEKERALASWLHWSKKQQDPLVCVPEVDRLGREAVFELLQSVVKDRPLASDTVALHHRVAAAYEERQSPEAAAPLLERILEVEPENQAAREGLLRVRQLISVASAPAAAAVAAPDLGSAKTQRPTTAPSQASLPAAATPAQEGVERLLDNPAIERLVSEVAAAAASQAAHLVRSKRLSGPVQVVMAEGAVAKTTRLRKGTSPGVVSVSLHLLEDEAVQQMREGPNAEEIQEEIGGHAPSPGNAEQYYRLGLAQVVAGEWLAARKAFEAVDRVEPGFRDAAARAGQIAKWQQAVTATLRGPASGEQDPLAERYQLLGEIGRGGMAVVYRAFDQALGREVAMKFLSEEVSKEKISSEMFQREARAAAQLNHTSIVTVYDVGVLGGRAFICMELVTGTSVEKLIQSQGRLQVLETLRIAVAMLDALEYAHTRNIIHRDIKPSNIMRNDLGVVKLMDFGLAKSLDGPGKSTVIAGTPAYMPPEQFTGTGLGPTTDLFALGASLYEMLAGKPPFEGMRRDKPPPRLSSLNPNVPKALEGVIHRSLELEQERRFPSAAEMARPIQQILGSVTSYLQKRSGGAAATMMGVGAPAKTEPAKAEPAKAEPAKAEAARAEPGKPELGMPAKAEAAKPEAAKPVGPAGTLLLGGQPPERR